MNSPYRTATNAALLDPPYPIAPRQPDAAPVASRIAPSPWSNRFSTSARRLGRVTSRTLWLIAEVGIAAFDYLLNVAFQSDTSPRRAQGLWLQRVCRRALRIFDLTVQTSGPIPESGLLVSNHLSYLDILVLGATAPAIFVAKHEVRGWPVFGWFAALAGTIFVRRKRRTDAGRATGKVRAALDEGALVVLFPEGTSSGGGTVLPFKSALLEPAATSLHPLTACFLQFELEGGSVADEVCYWRDMTLVPHLLNLLGKRAVSVRITFARINERSTDRKELARQLHSIVLRLKSVDVNAPTVIAS